ncbi:DUF3983 domain-containing protein [Bacillus sp. V5-8f]|nr:DUF3983 domain-containing protein [Bacillus sp. V5-8f]
MNKRRCKKYWAKCRKQLQREKRAKLWRDHFVRTGYLKEVDQ